MNILAIKQNEFQSLEIEDMIKNINSKIFFVKTILDAIKIIEKNNIFTVLINITSISDIGFIKYINDNFKSILIYISSDKPMEEAISIMKTGNYTLLHNPVMLRELKKKFRKQYK
ncbi:MAG: hypothetical protein K8S23_13290 [Candidatus Cloacimonetes bacterium]|nr:hypothetical protein [Candidatus Cloacimonadota bacterium]